ncbi:MAG: flagellar biosynthesis anti-sigma factor FlgM [Clostridiales bacterium]|jgi:flagellar biosynthesis anti-sigma factor FlgM|nr:flagellar biosynthesis anti-sigma factor FlgM [Clostridiales bacterium]
MDMKIRPANGFNKINSVSSSKIKSSDVSTQSSVTAMKADKKSDIITISAEGTFQAELDREIKDISEEINEISSDEKINAIKEQITNGTYFVSSEDVADAILDKLWF